MTGKIVGRPHEHPDNLSLCYNILAGPMLGKTFWYPRKLQNKVLSGKRDKHTIRKVMPRYYQLHTNNRNAVCL